MVAECGDGRSADVAPRTRKQETLWIVASAWVVTTVYMVSTSPTPLYPHWKKDLGFSSGTLTLIFGIYMAGVLVSLPIVGRLADTYGRKRVLLPGLLIAMVACGVLLAATSVAELMIARALTGVAIGTIATAGMATVIDVGGPGRARDSSLAASVAIVAGAGLGPLFAGVVAAFVDSPVVAIFAAELALLVLAFVLVVILPLERIEKDSQIIVRRSRIPMIPSVPRENRADILRSIAVYGPAMATTAFVMSLGPSIFADLLHIHSTVVTGVVVFAMFFVAIVVQFMSGRLSFRALFLLGSVATAAALAAMVVAVSIGSVIILIAGTLLAGAGQGWSQLGAIAMIGTRVKAYRQAEANAALTTGGYVQTAALPVCAGYLIDLSGLSWGTSLFGIVLGAAVIIFSAIVQWTLRPGKIQPELCGT